MYPRKPQDLWPAGCGPPRKICVVLPADLLAIAGAIGSGMPAKGVRAALMQVAQDNPNHRRFLEILKAYKKAHPEHDWDLIEANRKLKEVISGKYR